MHFIWPMVWCLLSLDREASTLDPAWQVVSICLVPSSMSLKSIDQAFDRAERALLRIERSVERGAMHRGRDDALRGQVASVVAELDDLIRAAGAAR